MTTIGQALKYLWSAPTTCLGLLLAVGALLGRGRISVVDGVLEVHGGPIRLLLERVAPLRSGILALTLGHVVLGRTPGCLHRTRAHERVHVRQCEQWGPFFIPAYLAASFWAWARGRRPYLNNRFERRAYRAATIAAECAHPVAGESPDNGWGPG